MARVGLTILCLVALAFLPGCLGGDGDGDGNGGSTGGTGVSGAWSGSGYYHLSTHEMAFTMTMNLTQTGNVVNGTYHIDRPNRTMDGTVSGTVSGGSIQLSLIPHGNASGTVSGGTMALSLFEDWGGGDGLNGDITLGKL